MIKISKAIAFGLISATVIAGILYAALLTYEFSRTRADSPPVSIIYDLDNNSIEMIEQNITHASNQELEDMTFLKKLRSILGIILVYFFAFTIGAVIYILKKNDVFFKKGHHRRKR